MVHHAGVVHHLDALLVLALWAAVGAVLAVRGFSWERRREG
jgi:ABC-2 type transport system permease protein